MANGRDDRRKVGVPGSESREVSSATHLGPDEERKAYFSRSFPAPVDGHLHHATRQSVLVQEAAERWLPLTDGYRFMSSGLLKETDALCGISSIFVRYERTGW